MLLSSWRVLQKWLMKYCQSLHPSGEFYIHCVPKRVMSNSQKRLPEWFSRDNQVHPAHDGPTVSKMVVLLVYIHSVRVKNGCTISLHTDHTIQIDITLLRIPTGRRLTSWLFTKHGRGVELWVEIQVVAGWRAWTRDFPITRQCPKLLSHACLLLCAST